MKDTYLWNPYTSVYKFLYGLGDLQSDDYVYGFGFGYKTISQDYEIVRISCWKYDHHTQVEIYSVKRCSWRRIQDIPYRIFPLYNKAKLVNGVLHWVAKQYLTQNRVVLGYDINSEKLKEVPLPDCVDANFFVMTMDEYLGVTCLADTKFIVAWIMVDYGVRESWMKLYVINTEDIPCSVNAFGLLPLCFMKNGAEILLSDLSCLYSYDTVSQDFKEFKIDNLPDCAFDATIYTESTVKLKTGYLKRKRTHNITGRRQGM
ncbi:F-box protein cpr1 [Thalictrum thalictroides]|uniref:F-box protein cpr1 n=1 Tax=Thalictrum thalictroides TaxID=46969 RepID=A0A7J6VYH1_THATH|nr:F-box protein cpr1 [Thalictrum thalictroides]